jgi:23S rRNA (adenine2503-C2)-methyltransferase
MGEGEPLNNRKMVFSAVRRLNSDLNIGARHITVSTVGLVPRIRDLADAVDDLEGEGALLSQIKLAVSLHATTDKERTAIMPVNKRFPVAELMNACQYYVQRTNRRISFEWALISGQNDSPKVADELGQLLAPLKGKCHVNVINVNPTTGFDGRPGGKASMERFLSILNEDWGIPATMRVRRKLYA